MNGAGLSTSTLYGHWHVQFDRRPLPSPWKAAHARKYRRNRQRRNRP